MSVKVKKNKQPTSPEKKSAAKAVSTSDAFMRHPLMTLRNEIDQLFENFFSRTPSAPFSRNPFDLSVFREPFGEPFRRLESAFPVLERISPKTDIRETDKAYEVTAELPGLDEKDIEVVVRDDTLTVRGTKSEESKRDKDDYHLTERSYGSFVRRFPIPKDVNQAKVDATFNKGVLKVTLPKTTKSKQSEKKIPIKGS